MQQRGKTMNTTKTTLMATAALSSGLLFSPASHAQQAGQQAAQGIGLEEIIVTTRKRAENLLEVPLSISAFTAADIEKSGISNVSQLATQTVGFTYHQGFGRLGSGQGGGASNRPSIRGMSNILGAPNAGFFVDGIYVSGNPSSYQLDNLERIEVVKGPQAALFGRGTFAGAINFVTRKPGNDYHGKLEITAGQHDHQDINGYVNGPIVKDKLFLEVNGRYYNFGGDYYNQVTKAKDIGAQKTKSFGGKIYATPTDNLKVELNYGYARDSDLGFPDFFNGDTKNNCFLPVLTTPLFGIARSTTRSAGFYCGAVQLPNAFYQFNDALKAAGLYGSDRTVRRIDLKVEYDIADWTLTSITARNISKDNQLIDNFVDGNRVTGLLSGGHSEVRDWSQEVRIASPAKERLRGLAGAYYYKEDNGLGFTRTVSVQLATLGTTTITNRYAKDASGVRNWAVFGQLEYDLTDRITVTAEGRYQEDKLLADYGVFTGGRVTSTLPDGIVDDTAKYKSFLPRISAKYKLSESSNVYASVARGNKPGGFTLPLPTDINPTFLAQLLASDAQKVKEEKSWNYEIGYKGALFDNRLVLTTALFWIDWTNQSVTNGFPYQRASANTFTTYARVTNAGKSRVRGLEIDGSVKANEFFDFRLGYSYDDAKILDYVDETERDLRDTNGIVGDPTDPTGQVKGRQIGQVPAHQIIVTGNLHAPIFNGEWTAFLRSDFTFESKRFENVQNLAYADNSYLLNLRAGVENDRWSLTLFYNNALNDKTPNVVTRLFNFNKTLLIPDPVLTFAGQPYRLTFFRDFRVGAPRRPEFGLTATVRF
jgi:outer membrane receptor protein involved in Fe transport